MKCLAVLRHAWFWPLGKEGGMAGVEGGLWVPPPQAGGFCFEDKTHISEYPR